LPIKLTLIFLRACCKNAADLRSVVARATCPRAVVISAAHLIFAVQCMRHFTGSANPFWALRSALTAETKSSSVPDGFAVDGAVERRAPPGEFITCNPAILAYLSPR
jgi:hypothetical protein